MKLNWNFLGGGGAKQKTFHWGEYGYFLEPHKTMPYKILPFSKRQKYLANKIIKTCTSQMFNGNDSLIQSRTPNTKLIPQYILKWKCHMV